MLNAILKSFTFNFISDLQVLIQILTNQRLNLLQEIDFFLSYFVLSLSLSLALPTFHFILTVKDIKTDTKAAST